MLPSTENGYTRHVCTQGGNASDSRRRTRGRTNVGRRFRSVVTAPVILGLLTSLLALVTSVEPATAADRTAITSYDRMAPGAPYHGYFDYAYQPFRAASNRITHLGVTVGTPNYNNGGHTVRIRLCTTADCSQALAEANPQIANYGNTAADIGDVAVTPGQQYFIRWEQPQRWNGQTWVTYWWAGGGNISSSDQMQAVVKGYNADGPPVSPPPPPPSPSTGNHKIVTDGRCANVRTGPGTSFQTVACLANGTTIAIDCQTSGGPAYTNDGRASYIWNRLSSPNGGSYVSDILTSTPRFNDYSPGIPRCAGETPREPTVPPPPIDSYNITTDGRCATIRTGAASTFQSVACLPNGTVITIECQTSGGVAYTNTGRASYIWNRLRSPNQGSYVSDILTNTPAFNDYSPGIPRCPGAGVPPPPGTQPPPPPPGGNPCPVEGLVDDASFYGPTRFLSRFTNVGWNGDMHRTYAEGEGRPTVNGAEWVGNITGGRYRVEAFIPRLHAVANTAYYVRHNGGQSKVYINQARHNDVWVSLGEYNINGPRASVGSNDGTGTRGQEVGWDAIRWVKRVPGCAVSPSPWPPQPPPRAPSPNRYVALGDSYSSGEGNPPFSAGTDSTSNRCHRSSAAYAYKVRSSALKLTHAACSGSIIYDFNNRNFGGNAGEGPQLDHLDVNTSLVTLTIGGNDLGFGYTLAKCAEVGDCSQDKALNALLRKHLDWLSTGHGQDCGDSMFLTGGVCAPPSPSLSDLYRQIAAKAKRAKIVILNYPSLFPRNSNQTCKIVQLPQSPGWLPSEQAWMNDWALRLNRAIKSQVEVARASGVNIVLADAWTSFGDHGVCTSQPWILGLRADISRAHFSRVSFHPNEAGQDAMVRAVRAVL